MNEESAKDEKNALEKIAKIIGILRCRMIALTGIFDACKEVGARTTETRWAIDILNKGI
ncbi:hypothetical protein MKW98_023438 [Papaver atlanticum]|uniref:Uncharacterized protein n=1 Tax=Papaver atlanticum TaxID=357466 RepID=A0AAD4SX13_9MAGN|nr:hypothetical protein MKW98_023438 [Papaver atlanticum]